MAENDIRRIRKQIEKLSSSLGKISGESESVFFKDFGMQYLKEKLDNPTLREATKRCFEHQMMGHLIPAFGPMPLDAISNAEWLKWVKEKKGITRFFNARKVLAETLIAARERGLIDRSPKLDNPDLPKNTGRVLAQSEIVKILMKSYRPFRFIFYCFFRMGCRPREVLQWEWEMIKWGEPGKTWIEIPARISKTCRTRKIPIHPTVSKILAIRIMRGNGSKFVFPSKFSKGSPQLSYNSAWVRACKEARIPKTVPYDNRRTFITTKAAEGGAPIFIAKILDTSVQQMEKVYAKDHAETMEAIIQSKGKKDGTHREV